MVAGAQERVYKFHRDVITLRKCRRPHLIRARWPRLRRLRMIQLSRFRVEECELAWALLAARLGHERDRARHPKIRAFFVAAVVIVDFAVVIFAVVHRILLVFGEEVQLCQAAGRIPVRGQIAAHAGLMGGAIAHCFARACS